MWVWKQFLEESRHTHNMERKICGLRPTVLSANLYQSYPLNILFLSQKTPYKVSLKSVPESIYQVFSKLVKTFKRCHTLPSLFFFTLHFVYQLFFINSSSTFIYTKDNHLRNKQNKWYNKTHVWRHNIGSQSL